MKKLITLLTGLLFVALSVGLTGCDDSDEQVNRPDERFVSGVVIPTALDVCEGLEMTIEEMTEMGNPVHHATIEARDALKG